MSWQEHAACSGKPLELFFPKKGESYKQGKAICHCCAVKQQCLDFALRFERNGIRHGTYGNLTPDERGHLFT